MGDIRKVIVDGVEFEVELDQQGDIWTAKVGGETFEITVPDAGPAPKQRRSSGGKSKKSGKQCITRSTDGRGYTSIYSCTHIYILTPQYTS